MGVIKIVIVDDEIHCTESLEIILKSYKKSIVYVSKFNNPLQAIEFINKNDFDILFLDIEMPTINGFELLNNISVINFDIIYTTAYNQYALKAFKYNAINYLLKPISEEELYECLEKWENKSKIYISKNQIHLLNDIIHNSKNNFSKIALPTNSGLEFITINDIVRCQSENNYTHFYLKNKETFLICRTLKEVEGLLSQNGFIRIHQSHLINPQFLKKFLKTDGGYVVMQDGERISVSKNNKEKLKDIFNQIYRN